MNRSCGLLLLAAVFAFPSAARAAVYVSEVAWMGAFDSTGKAQTAWEWFELHNDGEAADLSGWHIELAGDTKKIPLSGTIDADGYFLLARHKDAAGIAPDILFTNSLSNDGEVFIIRNASGVEISRLDRSDGWKAGDNDTKETMQWSGAKWITAEPTPKEKNAVEESAPAPEPTVSSTTPSGALSSHSSSAYVSVKEVTKISLPKGRDRIVTVGAELEFDMVARDSKGDEVSGVEYEWSFGDGSYEDGHSVSHAYEFPGSYVVIVNARKDRAEAVSRFLVHAADAHVRVATATTEYVELENRSKNEVNIQDWELDSERGDFSFPKDTILLPGASIKFPRTVIGIRGMKVRIVPPGGEKEAFEEARPTTTLAVAAPPPVQRAVTPVLKAKPAPRPVQQAAKPAPPKKGAAVSAASSSAPALTASAVTIYEGERSKSTLERVKDIFRNVWR